MKNNFKDVTDLHLTTTGAAALGAITAKVNGITNVTATLSSATAKAAITGDSLTTVSVKGGLTNAIDNTDTSGAAGLGETLKSVTFEASVANAGGAAANTIKGNAIDTLTLKNQTVAATTTITNDKSTALTVNLNNVNTLTSTVDAGSKAETITINSNGTKDNTLQFNAAAGKTLNITGDAKLTLVDADVAKDIVSTNTKGVTITGALGKDVKFTGGAGADNIKLTASFEKAINMGAGDDTVTYATASTVEGKVGSVDAGAGKDTIVMTSAEAVTASASDAFNTAFKNFEVLNITTPITSGDTYDIEKLNNVSQVTFAVALPTTTNTINNLVSNGTVKLTAGAAAASDLIVNVKNALTGTSDVLNLELSSSTAFAATFNEVTVANVETININVADANTTATGSIADVHNAILEATSATSIVVSGNNGLNLVNTLNTKVTNFDASGVVANAGGDLPAGLAVTFASANITAGEAVTIKGGEGTDTLTGTAQANDTISGGKGADIINYTGGKDSFTGGEGADDFVIGAGAVGTKDLYLTITDFSGAGKDGDTINVSAILKGTGVLGTKIAVGSGATFDQALDAAVKVGTGGTNGIVNWFQFKGDTYVVADNSNTDTYTAGVDSFIKINGLVDLDLTPLTGDVIA